MSSKLDQSLDEILAERPRGTAGRRSRSNAPAGGIRKRPQRAAAQKASDTIMQNAAKAVPTGPSGKATGSKIIVSNLVSSNRSRLFLSCERVAYYYHSRTM